MKPVIRIRLVENIRRPSGEPAYRMDGSDIWVVTITLTSSEGHVTYQSFSENQKAHALDQAYKWLEKYYRAKWYYPWAVDQWNKYQDMLDKNCELGDKFSNTIDLVGLGKITPEAFIATWDGHYGFHRNLVNKGEVLRKNDTHVTKKWSFWDWFRDTDNSNDEYK